MKAEMGKSMVRSWWGTWPGWVTTGILVALLFGQLTYRLNAQMGTLRALSPYLVQPFDSIAAQRLAYGGDLYDFLAFCNARLPDRATVLLITSSDDGNNRPYGREYVVYHRTFYALYPHRVWWVTDVPATRSPTWWQLSDLSAASLQAISQQHQASYALVYTPDFREQRLPLGQEVARLRPGASVWSLK